MDYSTFNKWFKVFHSPGDIGFEGFYNNIAAGKAWNALTQYHIPIPKCYFVILPCA